MFCKSCGKELKGNEKYCSACGDRVDSNNSPKKVDNKGLSNTSIIVIVSSIILIVIMYIFPMLQLSGISHTPVFYTELISNDHEYDTNIYDEQVSFTSSKNDYGELARKYEGVLLSVKIFVLIITGVLLTCIVLSFVRRTSHIEKIFSSNLLLFIFLFITANIIWSGKYTDPYGYSGAYYAYSVGISVGFILSFVILSIVSFILFYSKYKRKSHIKNMSNYSNEV